jgi:hypothetical protein
LEKHLSFIGESIIYVDMEIKSLLPSVYNRQESASMEKKGHGRFSEQCVFSIMDSLVTIQVGNRGGYS